MTNSPAVLLSVSGVSKRFGGARALENVSVDFHAGEVHALLGENGAGKSTLVKIIAGVVHADAGTVSGPAGSNHLDVAMVFQELSVVPELSVLDNMALSMRRERGTVLHRQRMEKRIRTALDAAGLQDVELGMPVEALPLAKRQLLEIARGLVADAKVLILDEPTATLSDVEIARVHEVVRSLTAKGHAIVYITHRLGEVFTLADRITIMRSGQDVANGPVGDFTMDSMVTLMLGEEHQGGVAVPITDVPDAGIRRVLNVSGIGSGNHFSDVSFTAEAGEVVALFGQIGSGADEVVRALVGLAPITSGTVTLDGRQLPHLNRAGSQKHGIAYVSADRVLEGVFLSGTVARNISSGALGDVSRMGVIQRADEFRLAARISEEVAFDANRINIPVGSLSGGNQQKIAIGRALATKPSVLVLNEPTRGVDIGARSEIYRALRKLASANVAVVVYSSDIVELRELADRVITMFRGRVVNNQSIAQVQDNQILAEILHGAAA
ncbi:sugar ABC transporter ATP-binding protein [Arthrobacter crystallopoietes]|uniref:sugar ABC transporter ATP-binding protein n=1 Tax=Crystallibacter crystallopoietes TaxID=37928 RepID=UPI003D21A43A